MGQIGCKLIRRVYSLSTIAMRTEYNNNKRPTKNFCTILHVLVRSLGYSLTLLFHLALSLSPRHARTASQREFFENFYRFFQYVASLGCRRSVAVNGKAFGRQILRISRNVRIFLFVYIQNNYDKKS